MKRAITTITVIIFALILQAQDNRNNDGKFSPEQFEAQLRSYITTEAHLTQQEATAFFPLYKEMQQKQRAIFDKQRQLGREKPKDEEGCRKAIVQRDEMDIELKRILQSYHKRFLEVLPASKVYDILKAESRFHRRAMKNWGQHRGAGGQHQHNATPPRGKRPQR
ncbi:MAG: hypothetical protein II949_15410 [Prevotella sp.]|nr:hypothetical protein [Prevotella sp.]